MSLRPSETFDIPEFRVINSEPKGFFVSGSLYIGKGHLQTYVSIQQF